MPRVAVRIHPAAIEEAEAAYDWYSERSLTAAQGFLEELERAVEVVSETPQRWPQYRAGTRRYVFPRFPFFLVYCLRNDQVEVIAVAHGRRRPGYWAKRTR
jgi:plasmid stabilization system protein ParE